MPFADGSFEDRKTAYLKDAREVDSFTLIDVNGNRTEDASLAFRAEAAVQLSEYEQLEQIFAAGEDPAGWTIGDFFWHPLLVPSADEQRAGEPVRARLDATFAAPATDIVAFVLPIQTVVHVAAMALIAESNMLSLRPLGSARRQTPIVLVVPYPNLPSILSGLYKHIVN